MCIGASRREMRRKGVHAAAVPADLVEAISKASNACETVWRSARRDSDFASVVPAFAEVLTLTQRMGEAKAAAFGCSFCLALVWSGNAKTADGVGRPIAAASQAK